MGLWGLGSVCEYEWGHEWGQASRIHMEEGKAFKSLTEFSQAFRMPRSPVRGPFT
jgi:hypothetical protein